MIFFFILDHVLENFVSVPNAHAKRLFKWGFVAQFIEKFDCEVQNAQSSGGVQHSPLTLMMISRFMCSTWAKRCLQRTLTELFVHTAVDKHRSKVQLDIGKRLFVAFAALRPTFPWRFVFWPGRALELFNLDALANAPYIIIYLGLHRHGKIEKKPGK